MVEIWVSASCLSAWAYADAAPRKLGVPTLCSTPRDTPLPGRGPGLGTPSVPHHQLTFCRVDSPDPTRSTPSPAIISTTARTPTSGSSSSTSSSSRGASARTRGTSASARTWRYHPLPSHSRRSRSHPSLPSLPLGKVESHGGFHRLSFFKLLAAQPPLQADAHHARLETQKGQPQNWCAPASIGTCTRRRGC